MNSLAGSTSNCLKYGTTFLGVWFFVLHFLLNPQQGECGHKCLHCTVLYCIVMYNHCISTKYHEEDCLKISRSSDLEKYFFFYSLKIQSLLVSLLIYRNLPASSDPDVRIDFFKTSKIESLWNFLFFFGWMPEWCITQSHIWPLPPGLVILSSRPGKS